MKIYGATYDQMNQIRDRYYEGKTVELFGIPCQFTGLSSTAYRSDVDLELSFHVIQQTQPPPETEEEKQLKQVIKLTEQDMAHKQRMIDNYSAKLKELQKKREGV